MEFLSVIPGTPFFSSTNISPGIGVGLLRIPGRGWLGGGGEGARRGREIFGDGYFKYAG